MTRTVLHLGGSIVALSFAIAVFGWMDFWMRVAAYGLVWTACAGVYFGVLLVWERAVDAFDARVRRIVSEELTEVEMRRYRRRLRIVTWFHGEKMRR